MNTAKQDRMSYNDLQRLADSNDIGNFLDDLEHAVSNKKTAVVAAKWGEESMDTLEREILGQGTLLKDEEYTDSLQEWVVSSESFLSKSGNGSFAHAYDSLVRGRSVDGLGSGKVLVKEARKCQRLLPAPHPNTSVFVCFAEERTDLCKAIIIGAADTPFSLGMFEFDILFPANYPASPPLFNFNTTGTYESRSRKLLQHYMRPYAFLSFDDFQATVERASAQTFTTTERCAFLFLEHTRHGMTRSGGIRLPRLLRKSWPRFRPSYWVTLSRTSVMASTTIQSGEHPPAKKDQNASTTRSGCTPYAMQ